MNIFIRIVVFTVLCLAQVLVLNHIHLWNSMIPLLNVYFALMFSRNYPKWGILLWCFAMGLCVDIFSNTPGVAAASMTLVAAIQPYTLNLFIQRDTQDDIYPTAKTLGLSRYFYYTLISVFVYCTAFFTLETFSFFNWQQWILDIAGSTALTTAMILAIENLHRN